MESEVVMSASEAAAIRHPPPDVERVAVREWSRVHLVPPDDIHWIEADDNNVVMHVAGHIYKGRGRISEYESQLDPTRFVRIHRSAIVRLASIAEIRPLSKGALAVRLRDGKTLRVARSRRDVLRLVLGTRLTG
jgi:two-component system, LytTR family, response regulator